MLNQPNGNDGRGTVNCDESGAIVDKLISALHETRERVSELEETVSEQQETIEEQDDRIDSLEGELSAYREENERDKADIRGTLTDADERASANLNVIDKLNTKVKEISGELERVNGGRSSLEQIVRLPDEIATESLSKNQLRSRAIASEITSVDWDHAMHGRKVIDSRAIRNKLRETYSKAHHQTVGRVMEFLDEMGGEDVRLKQGRKRKKLVFEPDLFEQLDRAEQLDSDEIDGVHTNGVIATVRGG